MATSCIQQMYDLSQRSEEVYPDKLEPNGRGLSVANFADRQQGCIVCRIHCSSHGS